MIPVRVDPTIRPHVVRAGFTVEPEHPLGDSWCPVCDRPLTDGSVSLVLVGREPEYSGTWTAAAVAVHDACTGCAEAP